jgi:hypothetical protein
MKSDIGYRYKETSKISKSSKKDTEDKTVYKNVIGESRDNFNSID